MPAQLTLYQYNSQWLQVTGLCDGLNPTNFKNSATLTATLYDVTGTAVPGLTDVSLQYVTSSNGNYQYLIPSTFAPQAGPPYTLKIDGTDSDGNVIHLELSCAVAVRNS